MSELSTSDAHCKKLAYPIRRRSFVHSYDLARIDKMTGFELRNILADCFKNLIFL